MLDYIIEILSDTLFRLIDITEIIWLLCSILIVKFVDPKLSTYHILLITGRKFKYTMMCTIQSDCFISAIVALSQIDTATVFISGISKIIPNFSIILCSCIQIIIENDQLLIITWHLIQRNYFIIASFNNRVASFFSNRLE